MEVEDARALCPPSLPSESAPGSPEAHSVKQESIWVRGKERGQEGSISGGSIKG